MKPQMMIAACAAAFALVCPTVAQAQEPIGHEQVSVKVRHGDLDLASAAGRKQFDRRFAAATRKVCGDPWGRDLGTRAEAGECASKVRASAAPAIALAMTSAQSKARRA